MSDDEIIELLNNKVEGAITAVKGKPACILGEAYKKNKH